MAETLVALQDINGTIKAGETFEAPDRILVAMGLARVADTPDLVEHEDTETVVSPRRRGRGRQTA
jgi:hypothetical protein